MDVVNSATVDGVAEEAVDQVPVDVVRITGQELVYNLKRGYVQTSTLGM